MLASRASSTAEKSKQRKPKGNKVLKVLGRTLSIKSWGSKGKDDDSDDDNECEGLDDDEDDDPTRGSWQAKRQRKGKGSRSRRSIAGSRHLAAILCKSLEDRKAESRHVTFEDLDKKETKSMSISAARGKTSRLASAGKRGQIGCLGLHWGTSDDWFIRQFSN